MGTVKLVFALAACLLALASSAGQGGPIHVVSAWARALPAVSVNGAAYLTLRNSGDEPDRLVGVTADIAGRAELHTSTLEEGLMKMRPLEGLTLEPGETVELAPGGHHVMLLGLERPLNAGEHFGLVLEFERAGRIEVMVGVAASAPELSGTGTHDHSVAHGTGEDVADGHGHGSEPEHAHAAAPMSLEASDAPRLDIRLESKGAGVYVVHLSVERLRFAHEHVDARHVAGEGHAHLYVDGEKVARLFGPSHEIGPLSAGAHEISVGLFTNDHRPYAVDGVPVSRSIEIEVGQ